WMHVLLPAKLERSQLTSPKNATDKEKLDRKKLPKSAFLNILGSLRRAVEKIEPRRKKTVWSGYANDNSYSDKTREEKHAFVGDFVKRTSPNVLIDLGCNDGEYSFLSCENGAGHVVGFELDREATDRAFTQSHAKKAPYLPLIVDIANPSPSQGWLNQERTTLKSRLKSDALIALAVIHHLVIGRNLPIRQVVEELMALAPKGVIEFVPKGDPMVDLMLLNREDIFPDYTFETFKSAIEANGVIKRQMKLSDSTRTFIEYAR
ncbi:MAG: class I SAM-dependent methyltransferase, partial [Pseudomonadota bacterium]